MSRKYSPAVVIAAIVFLAAANGARAGVGDYTGGALSSFKFMMRVEKAQYYSPNNNGDYCWYNDGWQGPGWYLCGDEWLNGFGWGGPYGWNGWGGGFPIRRHGSHGWRLASRRSEPCFRRRAVSRPGPSGAPASPGFQGGGFPAFHNFGGGHNVGPGGIHGPAVGGAPGSLGFQGGGVPAFHNFGGSHNLGAGWPHGPAAGGAPGSLGFHGGGVPAFHGFGAGSGGIHGFSAGGFQGGGAFSGGHGGGGHR